MKNKYFPKTNHPAPLLISEENSFAKYTFENRIPKIVNQIISENSYGEDIIENLDLLKQEVLNGHIRNIKDDLAPDKLDWLHYIEPFLKKRWSETPFLFAEIYFYRRVLEATMYFSLNESERNDPFKLQKELGLKRTLGKIEKICHLLDNQGNVKNKIEQEIKSILYLSLWGNRVDLSFKPSQAGIIDEESLISDIEISKIIIDDSDAITSKLLSGPMERIDVVADNSGLELFLDLYLISFILNKGIARVIYLHLKPYPIFVSDSTINDALYIFDNLCQNEDKKVKKFGENLKTLNIQKKLILTTDPFWNSPLEFWDMPEKLMNEFKKSDLVLFKGDANYRRLIGDRHWDSTQDFSEIVSYLPTAVTSIRTLKSEVIIGLKKNVIDNLNKSKTNWRTNGKYAILQLKDI